MRPPLKLTFIIHSIELLIPKFLVSLIIKSQVKLFAFHGIYQAFIACDEDLEFCNSQTS